jgi:hypothetical protein
MNPEIHSNKKLQELLNGLQPESITEDEEQPLGKYGRMAMEHLHGTAPQRFMLLKMTGKLMDAMYRVDEEATEQVEAIIQKLLAKDPLPQTNDILEKTRHFNTKRSIAEELVIHQTVLVAQLV